MPISAGVSKDSRVRTKSISNTEPAVGVNRRNVIRLKVCQVPAPDIMADSSSEGSMDLNAAVIIKKANGTCPTEWTQIIPGSEKTLNGGDLRLNNCINHTFR